MKILISILLISSLGLFANNKANYENDKAEQITNDCKCSSFYCSCDSKAEDEKISCSCGLVCLCSIADGTINFPTATDLQNENSILTQEYFKNLETKENVMIAVYFENLRNAIANEDVNAYQENAPLLENAFKTLTQTEQNAYAVWATENLTHVRD